MKFKLFIIFALHVFAVGSTDMNCTELQLQIDRLHVVHQKYQRIVGGAESFKSSLRYSIFAGSLASNVQKISINGPLGANFLEEYQEHVAVLNRKFNENCK
jgi:hypothetical protein